MPLGLLHSDFSMLASLDSFVFIPKNQRIVEYEGVLTSSELNRLIERTEELLQNQPLRKIDLKRIVNLLIESLQNISFHGLSTSNGSNGSLCCFILGKNSNGFTLLTGNYTTRDGAQEFIDRVGFLNELSPEEVRREYLSILNRANISAKGGAGLGVLRIRRESGSKINYKLFDAQNNNYLLAMCIDIKFM